MIATSGNIFRQGTVNDVPYIMKLIKKRIDWMDYKGINQWNKTHYIEHYPTNYYIQAAKEGKLYVLSNIENQIIASAVLLTKDIRWEQNISSAYYIHNLVSSIEKKNAGKEIIQYIEELARLQEKDYVKLDCAVDNQKLNQWYEMLGYKYVGTITDGEYKGGLREKRLKEE